MKISLLSMPDSLEHMPSVVVSSSRPAPSGLAAVLVAHGITMDGSGQTYVTGSTSSAEKFYPDTAFAISRRFAPAASSPCTSRSTAGFPLDLLGRLCDAFSLEAQRRTEHC
jgi:hypothetical protein